MRERERSYLSQRKGKGLTIHGFISFIYEVTGQNRALVATCHLPQFQFSITL